jgi:chemotaxis protein MotA
MLILAGLLIVFGSVVAGYLMERGNLLVLMQPAELLIIGGSTIGILLISSPVRNLRVLLKAVIGIRTQGACTQDTYLAALKLLYTLFQLSRRADTDALESHIEEPAKSSVFRAYGSVLADADAVAFICDSFRVAISAGVGADEIERLMNLDLSVQHSGRQQPLKILGNVADSLPGLGIIAAVLGVVVTMQALGGPANEIGQKVAAALVGTFLGILLCYGVIGPIVAHLECLSRARLEYLQAMRAAVVSFFRGSSPLVATEAGRRSIPLDLRPSFGTLEKQLRKIKVTYAPKQAAVAEGA